MTRVYIDCALPSLTAGVDNSLSLMHDLGQTGLEVTAFSSRNAIKPSQSRLQELAQPYTREDGLVFSLRDSGAEQSQDQMTADWQCWIGSNKSSLTIGFSNPRLKFRMGPGNLQHELLLRAIKGRSRETSLRVVDCTAGLARDAAIMASAGFQVAAVEQNVLLARLLQDSLSRCCNVGEDPRDLESTGAGMLQNLAVFAGDSIALMANGKLPAADVVYLDPMYDGGLKPSAAVKSEMQLLRRLSAWYHRDAARSVVGSIDNRVAEHELLNTARAFALKKVVVKRAPNAPYLADCKPASSLGGKALRFDIYPC